jgi:hypothetical protein
MRSVANPFPLQTVQSLLLHEMGHDLGLRHYFAGSDHPENNKYSDTVMDYLPFPIIWTMTTLGSRDQQKMDIIYKAAPSSLNERPCSDNEVIQKPYCLTWDYGPTDTWLMTLASQSRQDIKGEVIFAGGAWNSGEAKSLMTFLSRYVIPEFSLAQYPELKKLPKKQRAGIIKGMNDGFKKNYAQSLGLDEKRSEKVHQFLCQPKRAKQAMAIFNANIETSEAKLFCP